MEQTKTVTAYGDAARTLRDMRLAQALYEAGGVVMDQVLLTLHGDAHLARRRLEMRLFRREVIRHYEREVIPKTIAAMIAPCVRAGRADLVPLGYRITMNLTADLAGVDRTAGTVEETETLLRLVRTFSEGATLVHSTRDHETVRAEVRAALAELDRRFLSQSIERRQHALSRFERGEIGEADLPLDVLTILLRNEDRLALPADVVRREIAFYLQAGAHSTANSVAHAVHEAFTWCATRPEDAARLRSDPLFLQRCVHESLRLHPASPVAWRRAQCPVRLATGLDLSGGELVVVDMQQANRDPGVFGADAEVFNPHRAVPEGVHPAGLTFGTGVHACLGKELDGGLVPKGETDPAEHLYGTVTVIVRALLDHGARPDPQRRPQPDASTARANWGSYPILLAGPA